MSEIRYINGDGDCVQMMTGTLVFGNVEIPVIDGIVHLPETPFTRMITAAERDLLDRYRSGELGG